MLKENDSSNKFHMSMSNDEINFFKSYLKSNYIVFEWGAGNSTIEFSKYVKEYYSVEHEFKYYKKTLSKIKRNAKLYYAPSNSDSQNWFPYVYRDGEFDEFRDYVQFVHLIGSLDKKFDIVLIDGRARVECAIEVLPYLSDDAIVFIHDFDRHLYWKILNYYYVKEIVDKLAVLRKKEKTNIGEKDRGFLIKKYLLNDLIKN